MTANVYGDAARVLKAGDTMTGTLVLTGTPPAQIPAGAAAGKVPTSDAAGNLTLQPIPSASTSGAGVVQLDGTATDIQPLGTQAAGSTGKAADAGHVHPMPRLDQVGAPTAAVALNSQKITGLANGSASADAAAFGQIPVIDATATDIKALGTQAAGATGKVADAGHVHPMPRLDQVSAPTAAVALNSQKITGLANGSASTDAAAYGQITPISATRSITAATVTANPWDVLECNATSNAITVTLPTNTAGVRVVVKKIDSSANAVTISGTVDGVSNPTLTFQWQSMELVGDGTNWYRVSRPSIAGLVDYPATTDARYLTLANYGNTIMPSDHGFIAWTMDPGLTSANGTTLSVGYIYMVEVILRQSATINKIDVFVGVAGSTLTANQCFAGLYTSSGTRVGITADQSTNWTSAGDKQMALTSSYSAAAGKYYIALLMNGTGTSPTFACGSTFGASITAGNVGLAAGAYRFMRSASGQTSLPTSVSFSGYTPDANNLYAAVL